MLYQPGWSPGDVETNVLLRRTKFISLAEWHDSLGEDRMYVGEWLDAAETLT